MMKYITEFQDKRSTCNFWKYFWKIHTER